MSLLLGLEEEVDQLMSAYAGNVPGAAVGIYKDNAMRLAKGYGCASLNPKVTVSASTNFRLASVTKHMTAMAIMILKDKGALSYDLSLRSLFPKFPSYADKIKIKNLLHHTGGLKDYESLIPSGQSQQLSDHDVMNLLIKQSSPAFSAGSQYRYSNGGYVMLGLVVEAVSKLSFATFLRKEIFQPLGMSSTLAYVTPGDDIPHRAFGHSPNGSGFVKTDQNVTSATLGDGGVYASVKELFIWDKALYSNSLVSPQTLAEAFRPGQLNSGSPTSYGFGWEIRKSNGQLKLSHTGSTIGFRTSYIRFPEEKLSVIVLVNRANSSPWNLADKIADIARNY